MEVWQLALLSSMLAAVLLAVIWLGTRIGKTARSDDSPKNVAAVSVNAAVNQAFTEEFREELRNRARQQFEQIIKENAVFLQQDIRVSASKLDEFMKTEVINNLQAELAKHHETLNQTKQLVTDTLTKTQADFQQDLAADKERKIKQFDDHMADIVQKYVTAAVGDTIDPEKQLALVVDNLNAHKAEIIEDIRSGN